MSKGVIGNLPLQTAVLLLGAFLSKPCLAVLPPVITGQPTNRTVIIPGSATFQVVASSLSPLTYQWRKNSTNISGATSSSYTLNNVQLSDQGEYSVYLTNAGGWAISSNATLTVFIKTAPTLDATKSPTLTAQNEDAGSPSGAVGTLVSQLVDFANPTGGLDNVTDPDNGALLGIAVTDADASHGSWWYSTNNGANWNALGAVNELAARLLVADGNSRIYFKPDTNWNGNLTSAVNFRAWDQTEGSNGGTAVARASGTLLDTFSSVSYANNNGTFHWTGNWVDVDSSAASGTIMVDNSSKTLELVANNSSDSIYRDANLAGVASAVVSFNYNSDLNTGSGGRVDFQVSTNAGTSYITLATFSATNNFGVGTFSTDISAYAVSNTRIRFRTSGKSNPTRRINFDNVQIAYTSSSIGGASAFSLVKDSAALTVNAVNDVPVANNQSVSTADGTAKLITLTGSDVESSPLTFSLVAGPANGVLSGINANGTVTYTPNPGYAGADSFTFRVNDGTADSAAATVNITVTPVAPVISNQPQGQLLVAGQNAAFSVAATGTFPFNYQWKRDGNPLPGATNSMLELNNVQPSEAGSYTVVVANPAGSIPSAAAMLVVTNPPPIAPPNLIAAGIVSDGFSFQFSAPTGHTYVILASSNNQDWSPIYTNVALTASVVFTDPDTDKFSMRFYRALVQ